MQSTDTLDQAFLRSIQVPAVDPEQVSLVTDETTCTQALSAFNAERPQATLSR